jgi:hypothetical protein
MRIIVEQRRAVHGGDEGAAERRPRMQMLGRERDDADFGARIVRRWLLRGGGQVASGLLGFN